MFKIGVKKIGFVKKGRLSDTSFDRAADSLIDPRVFSNISFVQDSALLTDETVDDDKGTYHRITLEFTTRQNLETAQQLIEDYIGKPIIILVQAVDGKSYLIGNNNEPAYITHRNSYNRLKDRNVQTSSEYINLEGLFEVDTFVSSHTQPIVVNQSVVLVPWQGASGNIFVESQDEWDVKILNS